MLISDWSSDLCSSDLLLEADGVLGAQSSEEYDHEFFGREIGDLGPGIACAHLIGDAVHQMGFAKPGLTVEEQRIERDLAAFGQSAGGVVRSEEHTSELQSLMRISYAVFCLKK